MGWGGEDDVGEALWMGIVEEVGGSKSWGGEGGGEGQESEWRWERRLGSGSGLWFPIGVHVPPIRQFLLVAHLCTGKQTRASLHAY